MRPASDDVIPSHAYESIVVAEAEGCMAAIRLAAAVSRFADRVPTETDVGYVCP
jgi:hypothetical protein